MTEEYVCGTCFSFWTKELPCTCPKCGRHMKPPGFAVSDMDIMAGSVSYILNTKIIRDIDSGFVKKVFCNES